MAEQMTELSCQIKERQNTGFSMTNNEQFDKWCIQPPRKIFKEISSK